MARAPREVRRLLMKALREPDPERATELFLAARLLYTAFHGSGALGEVAEGLREIRLTLQRLLKSPSK
ncbi:MAG: hypothetical protein QXR17_00130 [Candidatus Bathyarchaeia archaeon]